MDLKLILYINKDSSLSSFFRHSVPESLKTFAINKNSTESICDISWLLNDLRKWFKITKKQIYIGHMKIKSKDFSLVIKENRNIETIVLSHSEIAIDENLDFSIPDPYGIRKIGVINHRHDARSYLTSDNGQLSNLFQAIAKSGLKYSLKKINVFSSQDLENSYSLTEAQNLALKDGLDPNLIVFEEWNLRHD